MNKFDALKDDDSGDHDQNEENSTQKDGEKGKKTHKTRPTSTTLSNIWARGKKDIKVSSGEGLIMFCKQRHQQAEKH